MSSSLALRFNILVAGEPVQFANPFAVPTLSLEEPPSIYTVQIAALATRQLWNNSSPLPTDFAVLAFTADQDCDLELLINDGAGLATLFLRAGGFPVFLSGSDAYIGGLSGTLGTITSVNCKNRNTTTVANVNVFLSKESA